MSSTYFKEAIEHVRRWFFSNARARKFLAKLPRFGKRSKPLIISGRGNWQPQFFAYRLIGKKTNRCLPLFRDLDDGLHKSDLRMSLKSYVSLMLLTTLIISISTMLFIPPLLHYGIQIPTIPSLLFGLGGFLLTGATTIISFYIYPHYRADSIKRDLNDSMAFTTGYLAILAGAGVHPYNMFRSLSNIPQKLAIVDESRIIVRDVELFGADINTALTNASNRTSSERFKNLLEGFIATCHSGGDLMSYLVSQSRQHMKSKRLDLQKFSDTLGVLSEFYVTLLVAGPLIFVVMFSVMSMLGGIGLGILNPTLLLMLLTYIAIPVGSIIFIIILDALMPRW